MDCETAWQVFCDKYPREADNIVKCRGGPYALVWNQDFLLWQDFYGKLVKLGVVKQ